MPLNGTQIAELAEAIGGVLDESAQKLFASNLNVDLATTIDVSGTSQAIAMNFVTWMNSRIPPRDGELLEALAAHPNRGLRTVARRLLTPAWFSPTADPIDAIALGKTAFVDRSELRDQLQQFVIPSPQSTRLLIVRGEEPCGKSYSFQFLRHFAQNVAGAKPMRLQLRGCNFTPRQFLDNVFALLGITVDTSTLKDDPQDVLVSPVISSFKNRIATLSESYWLIIDDLNDRSVTRSVRETAFALAKAIEDQRSDRLSVALLGYNLEVDPEYNNVAQDDPSFPTPDLVAQFYVDMASQSAKPLPLADAKKYARTAFSAFPTIDKAAMTQLTGIIETMGSKLSQGLRP